MWATKPYRDAVAVQRVIIERIMDRKPDDKTLAGLARAFCELEETKRKLKMRPLPKAVDVGYKVKGARKPAGEAAPQFSEPTSPAP